YAADEEAFFADYAEA
nr:P28.5=ascorbate peroxidase homolog {N-terminal} [Raphanus sativus=radish, cv Fakir, leaves, Peptide Partial, 15 aa] [Raphanus sativus]